MYKAFHSRDDIDRLYVSRREGGRGLTSIEHSMDTSMERLEDYIQKHGGRLITATRNNTNDARTNGATITRKQKWEEKQLYGSFKGLTSDISHEKMWTWLRKRNLKRETISSNSRTKQRHKGQPYQSETQQNSRCRLCGEKDETINHVSECSKFAQREYKTRNDWMGKVTHWKLCKKLKFDHTNK